MKIFFFFAFAFVAFVVFIGSAATSVSLYGTFATSGSFACSRIGLRVGVLSKFFIGNDLLLNIFRIFLFY